MWVVLLAAIFSLSAFAAESTYVSDGQWFLMKERSTVEGDNQRYSFEFTNATDGFSLFKEDVVLTKDNKLKTYHGLQNQLHRDIKIELVDHTLNLTSGEKSKTIQLSDEELNHLTMPPLVADFAISHWSEFKKGKKLELTLLVPDRFDKYSFYLIPAKDFDPERKSNTLELKASNFFVGLVAGTVEFVFSKELDHVILQQVNSFSPPVLFRDAKSGKLVEKKTNMRLKK